jgi:hypothetical protein
VATCRMGRLGEEHDVKSAGSSVVQQPERFLLVALLCARYFFICNSPKNTILYFIIYLSVLVILCVCGWNCLVTGNLDQGN